MQTRSFLSLGLRFGLALALGSAGVLAACGDDTSATGGGGAGGGVGLSNPGRVCIDNATINTVPPAGLKLTFRVLDENGEAVRVLDKPGDVTIINDEKGTPFGSGSEGDSVSSLGPPSNLELYSILVLDMSDSIHANGLVDQVVDGARAYVKEVVENGDPAYPHKVAIMTFGSFESIPTTVTFSDSTDELYGALEKLRTSPSLGTTDLYDAYVRGLGFVDGQGSPDAVVERFLVLISDGTHEAGATTVLRQKALDAKHASPANKLAIGIKGAYDACALEELCGRPDGACKNPLKGCREGITCSPEVAAPPSCTQFQADVDPAALGAAFARFGQTAAGIAKSNYAVGVCTPVELGMSSVTIRVDVDGSQDSETLPYNANILTGDLMNCNAEEVKNTVIDPGTGGGGTGGGGTGGGGTGGGGTGGGAMGGAGGAGGA